MYFFQNMFDAIDQHGMPARDKDARENNSLDAENLEEEWVPTYTDESLGYGDMDRHKNCMPVEANSRNPGALRLPQGDLPSRQLSAIFDFTI